MLTKFEEIYSLKVESKPLKEYIVFKNENPDFLVMFQLGSFYELYFEDAEIFSKITGAALTSRLFKPKIEIFLSGIPSGSLNIYIKKLLNNGIKVCVCNEFKDENGKTYREIVRKYTQGTILEDEFLESSENNFLMAIYNIEDSYNIVYADVSTGQIYKTTTNYKECMHEISKISPKEIIISDTQQKLFKNLISSYNFTFLKEEYFNKEIEIAIDKYCKDTQKEYKT